MNSNDFTARPPSGDVAGIPPAPDAQPTQGRILRYRSAHAAAAHGDAAVLIAAGSAVGIALIPREDAVSLFYFAAMGSFALAVAGFSSLSLMLLSRKPSLRSPISAIRTAALLLAFGEIGWAVYMIGEDLYEVPAAVMVATGAVLLMRFFGRLRELPIET